MILKPVFETEASAEVIEQYNLIKEALHLPSLPLFFAYMGAFPEYLSYITKSLVTNLKDDEFISLSNETGNMILSSIQSNLQKSEEIAHWIELYQNSPAFYYFQEDTKNIFSTNIKLALIFIALREALKGWAIAAKQLPKVAVETKAHLDEEDFIYDIAQEDLTRHPEFISGSQPNEMLKHVQHDSSSTSLAQAPESAIEKDLLPEYLLLCRQDFHHLMKQESYLMVRLEAEKQMINTLTSFPNLIFAPINVVLKLVGKYPNFADLLYLLSEHFPTYAMQRMMFSGFMIK